MNKRTADKIFKQDILPDIIAQYSKHDIAAINEAWNEWTDMLCKDGEITEKQYNTWHCPVRDWRE